jgi:Flp pilus assembly protein TadG
MRQLFRPFDKPFDRLRRGLRAGFLRDKRGAELVEAAATLPVVLMLVLAVIEFGWDLYAWQAAQQAARHGVRMGVVDQLTPAATARAAAEDFAHGAGLRTANVHITAPGGRPGMPLALRVEYDPPNFLSQMFGLNPIITAEATGRQEGW